MMPTMFRLRVALTITAAAAMLGQTRPLMVVGVVAGFALLAYFPGRALLPWLGIEQHWSAGGRTLLSVALSLAIVPFFLNPLWHFTHDPWVMLATAWAAIWASTLALQHFAPDAASEPDATFFQYRRTRIAATAVGVIVTLGTVLPYWPTELLGYPVPAAIHDFVKHHAVLFSLEQRPLPLGNVFYAAGADEPVHYYHFFYLVPATVRLWTNHALTIEAAFGIASAMGALALAGVFYATVKRFTGGEAPATLTALLVTVVGALDLIPLVPYMIDLGRPVVTLDAWAEHPYRIHNFLNQMIWSPQNVSGVLIVMVSAYVLSARGPWRGWLILGPILGGSLIGSSAWVAAGALPACALWAVTRPRHLVGSVAVGLLITVVSLPTLAGYLASATHEGRGIVTDWPVNPHGVFSALLPPGIAANLLNLPITLVLEFGGKVLFLALVPVGLWRKMWRDDGLRWLCIAAVVSTLAFCVFRSELRHNDFGQKIILLAMAFGAVMAGGALAREPGTVRAWNPLGWKLALPTRPGTKAAFGRNPNRAATVRERLRSARRLRIIMRASGAHDSSRDTKGALIAVVVLLGLPVGLYEAPLTAARRYIDQWRLLRHASPEERRAILAEGHAFQYMRHQLPADAVVQAEGTPDRAALAQLVRRQIGVMERQDDVLVFDPRDDSAMRHATDEVLTTLRTDESAARTYSVLRRHRITHVLIGRVERRAWSHLERFNDDTYFETVFRDGPIQVLRLHRD